MDKRLTPLKAIRKKCLDCCNGSNIAVRTCPITQCNLWMFRIGKHPYLKDNTKNPLLCPELFIQNANLSEAEMNQLLISQQKATPSQVTQ